jgi:hypothetical protein
MTDGVVEPPPLEAVDVYLYAFQNGAIYRYDADRASGFVTLAEALEVAETCGSFGGRVFLGGDVGALADSTRHAVRVTGVPIVEYDAPMPPYVWDRGGDALMTAAAGKQDDLLDDLIERGADVSARNDDGATALHHAAAAGYLHGIERLLAAGADPDVRNEAGLTPLMAAQACREHEAAMLLEARGASPSHGGGERVVFRWTHRLGWFAGIFTGLVFGLFFGAIAFGAAPLAGVVVFVVLFVLLARFSQSGLVWRGVAPRSFDGRRLHGATALGRPVDVDLDDVTQALYGGGASGRNGRLTPTALVLVHPGGQPLHPGQLRRLLAPLDDAAVVAADARGTVVLLDPWWEHEVLRPVGNRLISDPVELSPRLRQRLQQARDEDPTQPAGRPGRRRKSG